SSWPLLHTSNIAASSKLVTSQARSISAAVTTTSSVVAVPGANGGTPECQSAAYSRMRAAKSLLRRLADSASPWPCSIRSRSRRPASSIVSDCDVDVSLPHRNGIAAQAVAPIGSTPAACQVVFPTVPGTHEMRLGLVEPLTSYCAVGVEHL